MTTRSLREFTRFIWWMQNSAKQPSTLRPSHVTWAEFACRQLSSTTTIAIYYYYSARKLILIYRPTEGRSWVDLGTAGKVHTARANAVNHSGCAINTTAHGAIRSQDLAHCRTVDKMLWYCTYFCIFSIGSCSVFFCLLVIQLFGCYTALKLWYVGNTIFTLGSHVNTRWMWPKLRQLKDKGSRSRGQFERFSWLIKSKIDSWRTS